MLGFRVFVLLALAAALSGHTDANNHTISLGYDGFDRLATSTYPNSSTETYSYDADGNVLTRKTRAGVTITFTFKSHYERAARAKQRFCGSNFA